MPNIRSAAKRMRSDGKLRIQNQDVLSELKSISKKLYTLAAKDPSQAAQYARLVIKKYDKAASNGYIPKRRADRKKSRIAFLLAKSASK